VRVLNRGSSPAHVTLIYTPSGANGNTTFAAINAVIDAGRVVAFDDIVANELQSVGTGQLAIEGDIAQLEFERASFDLAGTLRTLHHVPRPELVIAELTRVTRSGGTVLVVDQIAPTDPLAALDLNRFERARDPSHTRALADVDLRQLFEANGLVLLKAEFVREPRELGPYLDLAGCEGEAREQAKALAPADYAAQVGWYLLRRP